MGNAKTKRVCCAHNVDDPDSDLYQLKEMFRSFYQKLMNRDLPVAGN
jgi:hypothetical protein